MARDGLFPAFGTLVNAGGTPSFALLITSLATIALVASGSFERLLGMASILYVAIYMTGIAAQTCPFYNSYAADQQNSVSLCASALL